MKVKQTLHPTHPTSPAISPLFPRYSSLFPRYSLARVDADGKNWVRVDDLATLESEKDFLSKQRQDCIDWREKTRQKWPNKTFWCVFLEYEVCNTRNEKNIPYHKRFGSLIVGFPDISQMEKVEGWLPFLTLHHNPPPFSYSITLLLSYLNR